MALTQSDSTTATPHISLRSRVSDDWAYILPMLVFLGLTLIGGHWPSLYITSYVVKTLATAFLLMIFWSRYTPIRWDYLRLGAAMGVIGVFQWVGMEKILLHFWPAYPRAAVEPFDPRHHFTSMAARAAFEAVRWMGASLVVPVMEELFWRDFAWRSVAAPADFKLARIGEWDRGIPLLVVALFFASVHVEWMTAIVWGLMIGWLLLVTRSIGACIVMHAVTNFLLGAYVLLFHDWKFW